MPHPEHPAGRFGQPTGHGVAGVQVLRPERGVIDAVGIADDRQGGSQEFPFREHLEPQDRQARPDGPGRPLVAEKPLRQPLLNGDPDRLGERPDFVDGVGREIFPGIPHAVPPVQKIGVIRPDRRQAPPLGRRPRRKDVNGQAGRGAETLLGGGENDIDAPIVHPLLDPARRADTVDDPNRAAVLQDLGVLPERGGGPRARVHVSDGHHLVAARIEGRPELAGPDHAPPRAGQDVAGKPEGLGDAGHPVSEIPLRHDKDAVVFPGHVQKGRLHGQRPPPGEKDRLPPGREDRFLEIVEG